VQGQAALDLGMQAEGADDGVGAQAHHELIAHVDEGGGLAGPAFELGPARVEHAVDLLAGAAAVGGRFRGYPAGLFHAGQLTVDLLVGGAPEVADGLVETAGEVVA